MSDNKERLDQLLEGIKDATTGEHSHEVGKEVLCALCVSITADLVDQALTKLLPDMLEGYVMKIHELRTELIKARARCDEMAETITKNSVEIMQQADEIERRRREWERR